jgi:hypothetical protein
VLAPALRVCLSSSDRQLKSFSDLSENVLRAAVDASVESMKHQLLRMHQKVKQKLATGSIDDFRKELAERDGEKQSSFFVGISAASATLK